MMYRNYSWSISYSFDMTKIWLIMSNINIADFNKENKTQIKMIKSKKAKYIIDLKRKKKD